MIVRAAETLAEARRVHQFAARTVLGETYAMGYLALTHVEGGAVIEAQSCRDPGWLPQRLIRLGRAMAPTGPPCATERTTALTLSDRETELLPLLAGTLSQREIGAVLHLSLNTVKTHSRLL